MAVSIREDMFARTMSSSKDCRVWRYNNCVLGQFQVLFCGLFFPLCYQFVPGLSSSAFQEVDGTPDDPGCTHNRAADATGEKRGLSLLPVVRSDIWRTVE